MIPPERKASNTAELLHKQLTMRPIDEMCEFVIMTSHGEISGEGNRLCERISW